MTVQLLIRWGLSAALLLIVWFHAHWSVALTLSLQVVTLEIVLSLVTARHP